METQITISQKIYDALCCLANQVTTETAVLQGCWQEVSTGDKVSIEVVRNEDGTFNTYEIHKAGGAPFPVASLADYVQCDESISINAC